LFFIFFYFKKQNKKTKTRLFDGGLNKKIKKIKKSG